MGQIPHKQEPITNEKVMVEGESLVFTDEKLAIHQLTVSIICTPVKGIKRHSVLARKEFEKKFEEDLKFYNDATIKEMIKLYE